jgi:hypothetical protein
MPLKSSVLIKGNFKPNPLERWLKRLERFITTTLAVSAVVCVGLYSIIVFRETQLIQLGQEARKTTEQNTRVEAGLHQMASFSALTHRLQQVNDLIPAKERLMVKLSPRQEAMLKNRNADTQWKHFLRPETASPLPKELSGF